MTTTHTVRLLPIPAGTRATECTSCRQPIFFAPHPTTGRSHPISIKHENAFPPTATDGGYGISHFADCKFAAQHRAKKA